MRDISVENTYGPAGSLLLVQRNGRKRQGQRRHMIINLVRGHRSMSQHTRRDVTVQWLQTVFRGVYNCSFVDKI